MVNECTKIVEDTMVVELRPNLHVGSGSEDPLEREFIDCLDQLKTTRCVSTADRAIDQRLPK